MTSLTTTTPAEQFRAKAQGLFIDVAKMSLHELVDEFQRLTTVMDENVETTENNGKLFNETAGVALRERRLVQGAARARFGISLDAFDRPSCNYGYDDF